MQRRRTSGVFLHLTSLPGSHGIGDLGAGARAFLQFLDSADQTLWQFCPLGPTSSGTAHSPYAADSAFAGNPLLIDLDDLADRGYLSESDLDGPAEADPHSVNYDAVESFKTDRLRSAYDTFATEATDADREAFESFRERESAWLADYTLFAALKDAHDGVAWTDWPDELAGRDPDALAAAREKHRERVSYHAFVQWVFDEQWQAMADYADENGIGLVGDVPIYVALDSADVWSDPDVFLLDEDNQPTDVAGVPPNPGDDGQKWGNPLYDWDTLRENGYEWWVRRFERLFDQCDIARIDHFKGFDEFWAIPAQADTPAAGQWLPGPGEHFFETVEDELGELPFLVEDLGFLDESIASLRDHFDFPGMRVPQYAAWCEQGHMYQPMHYPESSVAYTSTHDTDTIVGFYRELGDRQRDCLKHNLGTDGVEIEWDMIEAVWNSDAIIAMTTVQDLLGLDSDARFNVPGTATGNWRWRVTEHGLSEDVADRLRQVTDFTIR
jgi:4-alpha-glucanotransferase